MQCKERVDILEALETSRKDAEKEAKKIAREERSAQRKGADRMGSSNSVSLAAAASSRSAGGLGGGTVPPVNYGDLAKPAPPLPARPVNISRASTESLTKYKSRGETRPHYKSSHSTLPAAPTLPIPKSQTSRSPSPDQRKITMLTTLRKGDGRSTSSSKLTMRKAPTVSSKAAGMAWDQTPRESSSQSVARRSERASFEGSTPTLTAARVGTDEARPVSDDDRRRKNFIKHPDPSDFLPSESWREPQRPEESADGSIGRLGVGLNRMQLKETTVADDGPMISSPPPAPPPHDPLQTSASVISPVTSPPSYSRDARSSTKPNLPTAGRGEPPELSYRREYPPAALKPGATSIGVSRRPAPQDESGNESKKTPANTSTPRTTRTQRTKTSTSTSSGSEEKSRPKKPSQAAKRKEASPRPRRRGARKEAISSSSSDDEVDLETELPEIEITPERIWELRSNAIMKDLPRGVDEQSARQILNDIVVRGDEVHWSDIAGLEGAKKALKEAVVYPFLRPDLFMGLREPARGMLLFGPPGTGKTMLARAVATESKSTFFAISASSLTSKWHGESEKLVRALFALAKKLAPSIIFVDEIDSLLSTRSSTSEHEASRRSKTEFLIQWSDLQRAAAGRDTSKDTVKEGDASRVLVLAATNVPWDIDEAARRRFVRRQYIPLPEDETRRIQVLNLLSHQKHSLTDEDIEVLVHVTEGSF